MEYIFPVAEMENYIFGFLDPFVDFKKLFLVNKYYHGVIINTNIYIELKNFRLNKPKITFSIDNLKKEEILFILACQNNYLLVAKYLLHEYTTINIHAENEYAFRLVCAEGHLKVAMWLYDMAIGLNSPINIHEYNDCAFMWACSNGHLEIAMWLYNLDLKMNSSIDIHANNELAFGWACSKNHLQVAKWLYDLGKENNSLVNTNIDNDYAFKWSCIYGHLEVAEWLCTLCDKYQIDINPITKKIKYSIN